MFCFLNALIVTILSIGTLSGMVMITEPMLKLQPNGAATLSNEYGEHAIWYSGLSPTCPVYDIDILTDAGEWQTLSALRPAIPHARHQLEAGFELNFIIQRPANAQDWRIRMYYYRDGSDEPVSIISGPALRSALELFELVGPATGLSKEEFWTALGEPTTGIVNARAGTEQLERLIRNGMGGAAEEGQVEADPPIPDGCIRTISGHIIHPSHESIDEQPIKDITATLDSEVAELVRQLQEQHSQREQERHSEADPSAAVEPDF